MDVLAAYREVGSYRGAAAVCGTTHKTVKRIIEAHEAGQCAGSRRRRGSATTTRSPTWSRSGSGDSAGRISAKRLLPEARAAGYAGSARNFRRLVADAKTTWRRGHHAWSAARRSGRPERRWSSTGVSWTGCTCSARCWPGRGSGSCASPRDEKAATTLAMLAECFEVLGGVPEGRARRPDGLPEGRRGRERGGADPGLCPVRDPLPVPARLLRGRRPGVQGDRGEPRRLRQATT